MPKKNDAPRYKRSDDDETVSVAAYFIKPSPDRPKFVTVFARVMKPTRVPNETRSASSVGVRYR